MNPICTKTTVTCFSCTEPCQAPAINPEALTMPTEGKPFLGILAPLAEMLGVETNLSNKFKLNVTLKL